MSDINKKRKRIGYVILSFLDKDKQEIKNYFNKCIDKKDYFFAKVSGKNKGGLVLGKMHVTLFYGLDDKIFDKKTLDKIKIDDIKLGKLELFYIKEFKCNALVLKIDDKNKKLEKIHSNLSELDIMDEKINKFKFAPHITIAYVKKDFNITDKDYFLNKKLKVRGIEYKVRSW